MLFFLNLGAFQLIGIFFIGLFCVRGALLQVVVTVADHTTPINQKAKMLGLFLPTLPPELSQSICVEILPHFDVNVVFLTLNFM